MLALGEGAVPPVVQCAARTVAGARCALWHTRKVQLQNGGGGGVSLRSREAYLCATHRAMAARGAVTLHTDGLWWALGSGDEFLRTR